MSEMIDPATSIRPSPRAAYRKLTAGAGAVLLNLDTAAYHGLNEMGALIWSLIEGGTTYGDLVRGLRDRLEDAPPQLEADVTSFLRDLEARDLVILGDEED
jgi:hypothetical protein